MRYRFLALLCILALLPLPGCRDGAAERRKTLNVYIWSEYLPQDVIDDFARQHGLTVNVDTYDSNETLLAKLASGAADYDVVVPSDYMVRILIRQGLAMPLDRAKLPNFVHLDPWHLDKPFDPGNKHSVPYFWGTTCLAYDKQKVTGPVGGWDALFDPKHKNQVLMLNDMRECFAVALKRMGRSINETDPRALEAAAEMLKRQHELVRVYDSEDFANKLASGEVALAHGYNGQLAKLAIEQPDRFAVVLPKEGGTVSIDNLVIPAKAGNPEAAHAFINFVTDPKVAARIANAVGYASPNAAARPHIKPELLNSPAIFPPAEALGRFEFMEDLGQEATDRMDKLWTRVKTQ